MRCSLSDEQLKHNNQARSMKQDKTGQHLLSLVLPNTLGPFGSSLPSHHSPGGWRMVGGRRCAASHHLSSGVSLLLLLEHRRVQRHPSPGPVLAGEHHHGGLHLGHWFQAGLQHMGRGHGEPVGVGVPGLQPAALLLLLTLTRLDALSLCHRDACPHQVKYREGGAGRRPASPGPPPSLQKHLCLEKIPRWTLLYPTETEPQPQSVKINRSEVLTAHEAPVHAGTRVAGPVPGEEGPKRNLTGGRGGQE